MTAPRHPSRAHLVAVTTAGDQVRGSGYLLNPRLVLTAGHVAADVPPDELRVCRLSTLVSSPAEVVSVRSDVAFLLLAEDLAEPGDLSPVHMADLAPDTRFGDCSALGLPGVMTRPASGAAPLEAAFRVAPNTADRHGYLSLEVESHPPEGAKPWSGMSGAPVFHAGRWLVGVIVRDSVGWQHSRLEAAPIGAFFEASPLADAVFRVPVPLTEADARDAAFLDAYRKDVIRRYGHIELFGLGRHGHLDDDIGIEHAYVSLDAGLTTLGLSSTDQSRPVEQLLPKNPRLLLRGDPGAGKSTLLEWLAVSMARNSCKGPLEPFNHRVPFLIRLRDMYAPRWKQEEGRDGVPPAPEEFLRFNRMATGAPPPDGWLRRVLEQNRALLLVDGLDEVLESHRDGVLNWVNKLLRDFRDLPVIVTGRPEALLRWSPPTKLGFVELKLLELNKDQRAQLIHKWHAAAKLGVAAPHLDDEERERRITRLTELEAKLIRRIDESHDLSTLAATPLLCAVLCKLHEVHGARLPRFRQELYAKTVDMMLGLRDADRKVPDPLPEVDVDQRRAILSWVAGYLTTEGEREITLDRFDDKVRERLRSLGHEAGTHTPEEIRKALHERSGLLVAPAEDTLRFSHRTFQDYLAATDMVAQRAFGQLAGHAGDESWDDILRFAMSQCSLADTHEFVSQFRKKLRLMTNRKQKDRMRMAAAACIPYAVQMSEDDRRALVSGVAKSFWANSSYSQTVLGLSQFVAVGPDLLVELQRVANWKESVASYSAIRLATAMGGPEALRFLAAIPDNRRRALSSRLADAWMDFPGPEFADEILSGLNISDLPIGRAQQLVQGRVIGRVGKLRVAGRIPMDAIAAFANEHAVDSLYLDWRVLWGDVSLAPLDSARSLSSLNATGPDVSLRALFDDDSPRSTALYRPYAGQTRFALPALPHLRELSLASLPTDWAVHTAGWASLSHLGLYDQAEVGMHALAALPALTHLVLTAHSDYALLPTPVHPGVTHLFLLLGDAQEKRVVLSQLLSAFPSLVRLTLLSLPGRETCVDLKGLERVPHLRVRLNGFTRFDPRIIGVDASHPQLTWR
ncbi:NACHT domain-containing protein [Streptomyces sp. yr375]|uniref:serine protease n=1 Tax=Streptomyces sp. yr375 TaxID=1761906 RepID=UPI0008B09290|nr:serine protease [Streptomyces sp. yr375]SEP63465.1 NACHT domain-containing protein [Streptomyces sp. yr375]